MKDSRMSTQRRAVEAHANAHWREACRMDPAASAVPVSTSAFPIQSSRYSGW